MIGKNGVGKKLFVSSLCEEELAFEENKLEKLSIVSVSKEIIENSVPIKLNISITSNFGNELNNKEQISQINQFIENKFQAILDEETKINRVIPKNDSRIHLCLYFIDCKLSELDIKVIEKIGERVNLIPVLNKVDCLTRKEFELTHETVVNQLENMKTFNFIDFFEDSDYELVNLQKKIPFGIVSRGRNYKWGKVDLNYGDFKLLKTIILTSHLQDFKEITELQKYELFRLQKLTN